MRLCAYVKARRANLLARMKVHHYRTGTHTIHPAIGSSGLIVDESNSKYRYFLKVRNTDKKKDGQAYLPLLVDRKRIDPAASRTGASFLLKATERKVHVVLTYEADAPSFVPQARTLGLDANTKNNLLQAVFTLRRSLPNPSSSIARAPRILTIVTGADCEGCFCTASGNSRGCCRSG